MSIKADSYVINISQVSDKEVLDLIYQINNQFRKLEDRLDEMEAIRGSQYFNTYRWELEYVGEE